MSSRRRIVFVPDRQCSKRTHAVAARQTGAPRTRYKRQASLSFIAALVLLSFLRPGVCQDGPEAVSTPGSVTASTLEAKIAEAEAAVDPQDNAKTKLVELYRKALSNLAVAASSRDAAQGFQQASRTAPAETQALREKMDKSNAVAPEDTLEANPTTPLREIEALLHKEKADFAALDAQHADFAKRLAAEASRPALIRQRLTELKEQQDEIAAQLKLPLPTNEGPATTEARAWVRRTGYEALSTEITMLDQELLSQPDRVVLLKAKQDRAAASIAWVGKRVKILDDLVTRQRQAEADEAKTVAAATRQAAEGRHPMVVSLAEQNAALTEEVADWASELNGLAAQIEEADKLARQLEEDFQGAQETVTFGIYGLNEELGHLLQQQRQSLPDLRSFRRQARERDKKAGKVGVRRLLHRRELKRLSDPASYVAALLTETAAEDDPEMRQRLVDLAMGRKVLLEKATESDDFYLRKLGELESAQQRLLATIERFDEFLDVHLLWVRSASRSQLHELGALPAEVWGILSPSDWYGAARALAYQATHSPVFILLALALGTLLWSRKRLIGFIETLSGKLGEPTTDHFLYSLQTLAAALIAAAAWPLVAAVAGWQLKVSVEGTDFSSAVGEALLALALQFYLLRVFRLICIPRGLAAAHFRWPESSLRLLRRELGQLSWIYLPAAAVALGAFTLDPLNAGWAVGRAAFLILVASLAFAFYRLLHPDSGVLAAYLDRKEQRRFRSLHRLWFPLLVIAPLALGVLSLMGYLYTARTLVELLLDTTWMVVGLVLLAALAQRWLQVTRQRIAYEAAMERRQTELETKQEPNASDSQKAAWIPDAGEQELDLEALSDTSSNLINTALVVTGLIGLWMIWSEVFPALRIFDDVPLWNQIVTVDGEEQIDPITVADLILALVYGAVTFVLAKQLPAMLEIILLYRFEMSAGSRYTFTTLTTYIIITVGILLVFNTIGAQWSQLQWLVAALGVGIGFGLQEIVANFISGLIVLFERPIRIGDVVTVGDTDGTVTRIRIRATTISSWDGKELLVPNKEFITGRLLNWSLSDQKTRIVVSVGIAYGSDVRQAMRLLEEAAVENENVLDDPAPSVIFESFGDNSLGLLLRSFVNSAQLRYPTISALNEAINDKFNSAGIVIAFPQRDLHLDTTRPLQVELHRGKEVPRNGGA